MTNPHLQEAKALAPYLQDIFFRIHQNPELGRQEYKTQALVLAELQKMGIEAEPIADTGVIGLIRGGKPGKTIAFRADMDALPLQEITDLPYRSQIDNVMHACGHDAHTTVLLGASKLFAAHREELQGNIKLFFQPNEEGDGGAERMIEAGCMENPRVDAVFFGHNSPAIPVGTISVKSGPSSAASNTFDVTFRGKGTHGAHPDNGTDVIVAACQAVTALQTISSRRNDPIDPIVVTVGAIYAGSAANIVPETAVLKGMIRTMSPETRARAKEDLRQIVIGIAAAMNVEVEIDLRDGYAATVNDDAMTQLVQASAGKVLGAKNVYSAKPSLGAEDFGYFSQMVPGCYYHFGSGNPAKGCSAPFHNPKFTADPDSLPYAVALYLQIAEDFLSKR